MYNNSWFRRMLHANLSIEVYRVKNSTTKLGITHREGTIFLDNEEKVLYISKINTLPFHTLAGLLLDDQLVTLSAS